MYRSPNMRSGGRIVLAALARRTPISRNWGRTPVILSINAAAGRTSIAGPKAANGASLHWKG